MSLGSATKHPPCQEAGFSVDLYKILPARAMATFTALVLPPPRNWQDFEDICCDLWRRLWHDPETQKNGRSGQPQAGIDVFGRPGRGLEWAGIQCKLRSDLLRGRLSLQEIKTAVAQAQGFKPILSILLIITTAPRDADIQEEARRITGEQLLKGSFSVSVVSWEDVLQDLAAFPDLIAKHFPDFGSSPIRAPLRWDGWRPLPERPVAFHLLDWRVHLTRLFGRDLEHKSLLEWADNSDEAPRLRVVSGSGGTGKSRLAAEVCQELGYRGWCTAFFHPSVQWKFEERGKGLLLVVDYPEERQQEVKDLVRAVSGLGSTPGSRIRLLLLSRQRVEWWRQRLEEAHLGHFLDDQEVVLGSLGESDAVEMFLEACSKLSNFYGLTSPSIQQDQVINWRSLNAELHSRPLIITAAALHATVDCGETLGLGAGDVLQTLARREKIRLENEGEHLGLGKAAARLAGLAVIAGGIAGEDLGALAHPRLRLGFPRGCAVEDLVPRLHLWQEGCLRAPTPDIMGVALLLEVLEEGASRSPEWLWVALQRDLAAARGDLLDRIARLLFDAGQIEVQRADRFRTQLVAMVEGNIGRASRLESVVQEWRPPDSVLPWTVAIYHQLIYLEADVATKAERYSKLARHLELAERPHEALEPIQQAVILKRNLILNNNNADGQLLAALAESLHTLAATHNSLEQIEQAISISREQIAIRRQLLREDDDSWHQLAMALNNLASYLKHGAELQAALSTIKEVVEIYRLLVQKPLDRARRKVFEDSLARGLYNLSDTLEAMGDIEAALAAITEGVEIRRPLADAEPHRYGRNLALSLHDMASLLGLQQRYVEAITTLKEAIRIRSDLVKSNPIQSGTALIASLSLGVILAGQAGDESQAVAFQVEELATYQTLLDRGALASTQVSISALVINLVNVGNNANQIGHPSYALRACDYALTLLDKLGRENAAAWDANTRLAQAGAFLNRGNAHHAQGSRLEAIADYTEAIRLCEIICTVSTENLGPQNEALFVLAYLNRSGEYLLLDQIEPAASDFDAAKELAVGVELGENRPHNLCKAWAQTLNQLAQRFESHADDERSVTALIWEIDIKSDLHSTPRQPDASISAALALVHAGDSCLQRGQRQLAVVLLERALAFAEPVIDFYFENTSENRENALNDLGYGAVLLAELAGRKDLLDKAECWLRQAEAIVAHLTPSFLTYAISDSLGLTLGLKAEACKDFSLADQAYSLFHTAAQGFEELRCPEALAITHQHLARLEERIAFLVSLQDEQVADP